MEELNIDRAVVWSVARSPDEVTKLTTGLQNSSMIILINLLDLRMFTRLDLRRP